MPHPLVSIIIPCYNQDQYLDMCLQSVSDQTYQNWECIIVNDGSTDSTGEIAENWVQKDGRFLYIKHDNRGVAHSRNAGLKKATGQWIQFLDGDDLLLPTKLEESLKFKDDFNFIYTDFQHLKADKIEEPFCNLKDHTLNIEALLKYWDQGLNIPIHTPIIKKEIIDNLYFYEKFQLHEDWLFWVELLKNSEVKIKFIDQYLTLYRIHPNNSSGKSEVLAANQIAVYDFAYSNILDDGQRKILFRRFLEDYYIVLDKKNLYAKFHYKIINSRYFKFKSYINKLTTLFKR
ncbi:hypothetical protein BA768_05415 [Chryseobacterium sp. CBo1]|uniref:glycosyltransferase family 2 protein n=1 Tax=Chryseobacterium sp. CBo1 TaxID=1869230 RepID=UPI0008107CF3|nr:glycosyltransferase family 2 protein [Chryseobacterium sp. CBo1]OCK50589.1 hypothetical protein BA768_05415 [Chryseobacterium sp. CBo1]